MPLPDRWENYVSMGGIIAGTRILCFKVPLRKELVARLDEDERFTPTILMEKLSEQEHELGLVIDLTFTKKYYNSKEFTEKGVQYEKIFTKGHEVPSDHVFGRFAHVIDEYLAGNEDNTSVIGVHCTHGVNRTGYLVCRYMLERLSFDPDKAIEAFNAARGHDLERVNYIEDLQSRTVGERTPFDPDTVPPEEDLPSKPQSRSKFMKPGRVIENSYSKLKEKHQRHGSYGNSWSHDAQRERDHQMRDRQGNHNLNNGGGRDAEGWRQRSQYHANSGGYYGNNQNYQSFNSYQRRRYQGDNSNGWDYYGGYQGYHEDYRSPMQYNSYEESQRYADSGWGTGSRNRDNRQYVHSRQRGNNWRGRK